MPKPTREQVVRAYADNYPTAGTNAIMALIDTAWGGVVRDAFNLLRDYGRHHSWCMAVRSVNVTCTCGFKDAWDAVQAQVGAEAPDDVAPETTPSPEPDDLERFNQKQRLKRAEYIAGRISAVAGLWPEENRREASRAAAFRYPLKKRVPKAPVTDPHGYGEWRSGFDHNSGSWHALWREGREAAGWRSDLRDAPMLITSERVGVLAALLADPSEVVDDVEPEEET